uniref:Glucosidase II subunit alpha n=1 Tax=Angiostrongylus cantonensis TaxID=6313 RepID=A0A158P988_ANGCA
MSKGIKFQAILFKLEVPNNTYDSSVRIQIDESEESIRKRFIPTEALDGEPEQVDFSSVEIKSDSIHLTTGDGKLKVVVTFKPFFMGVYNEYGELVAQVDISFIGFRNAYGLPEHADSFALKSTVGNTDPFRLYNLDVFEYELGNPMSLYLSVPYIVAHRKNATIGALWLNAAETWIDTQSSAVSKGLFRSVIDRVMPVEGVPHFDAHFVSETGVVDIFFFGGPGPRDVQRQLSRITGVTPLPPIFSIGYHQSRWNYNDEEDVDQGRKMVTIVDPHIKIDNSYPIYKDAKDLDLYVKKSDGSTNFEGHCWPGSSAYLDFLNPQTRQYWAAQFTFERYIGSTPNLFTWNDMNEPSVFSGPEVTMNKDALHFGGIEHREVHNMYGLWQHSSTFQGQMQRTGGKDRPFILTRSGFVGTQRTAAVWTGDNTADWGHLAITAAMLLSLSVSGVPFVGADVGGFFGNPDEQLLTRWYQAGSFQPFFRAHAHIDTKRREPWLFSSQTLQAIRQAIRRRYALLPYWYTLFHEHMVTGAPPMRPMWFEFPNEENLYQEEKTWMVGSALLVRPVVEKDTYSVKIDFPTEQNKDPLTLFIALDEKGYAKGSVYLDDGATHDYIKGAYISAEMEYKTESPTNSMIAGQPTSDSSGFETETWIERIVVQGLARAPHNISVIRSSDPTDTLEFSYNGDRRTLTIRKPLVSITQSYKIHISF